MNTVSKKTLEAENNSEIVEAELNRLLSERKFAGAPQMSAFLKYVVQQTLTGQADRIKAYSVGVDALGKPDTFDAQTDPSVRVLALRLRKTLRNVYATTTDNLAIIELKVGTYVPEFYKPTAHYPNSETKSSNVNACQVNSSKVNIGGSSAKSIDTNGVFAGKKATAVKPMCNTTAASSSLAVSSLPSRPKYKEKYNASLRTANDLISVTNVHWFTQNRWVVLAGVVLLAAAWQISIAQSAKYSLSRGPLEFLPATISANYLAVSEKASASVDAPAKFASPSDVPTVYIEFANNAPDLDRQVMLMLTSSFVQAGTVSVVRHNKLSSARKGQYWPGEYQLIVDRILVGDNMRINVQVISLSGGELLYTDFISVDGFEQYFSAHDLLSIESMAIAMVSLEGPLFRNYCAVTGNANHVKCPTT